MSKDIFRSIRNTVISSTGIKITDEAIAIILLEYHKLQTECIEEQNASRKKENPDCEECGDGYPYVCEHKRDPFKDVPWQVFNELKYRANQAGVDVGDDWRAYRIRDLFLYDEYMKKPVGQRFARTIYVNHEEWFASVDVV